MVDTVEALDEALAGFATLLASDAVRSRWDDASALDGYSVGGLASHVVQGVAWLAQVAAQDRAPDDVRLVGPGGYFAVMKREPDPPADPAHDRLVAMGNDAAAHGWEATFEHARSSGDRARAAVDAADLDRVVDLRPVLPFGTTVRTFATTRIVELVVHGDDLAVSVGLPGAEPGPAALEACGGMLVLTAGVQHSPPAVVRALARRERTTGEVFPVF